MPSDWPEGGRSSTASLELVPTGISGLDRLLLGGFPRGALVLLAGNPGTGKSTIATKFLYEGAVRASEPGIYVNFVETKRDFVVHMKMLGMDLGRLEDQGLFHYEEALTIVDEDALIAQLEKILHKVVETGAKRLVVDSVTAMLQIIRDRARIRELVQNFFVNGVKQMGVTTILIAEHPYGAKMVGYGIEEFIVDAVIILRFEIQQGKVKRLMELRKARWAPIRQAEIPFYIRPGVVVELSLPETPEEVPPLDLTQMFDLSKAMEALHQRTHAVTMRSAIRLGELRRAVFSVPRGAQVLLGHYPTLDSKHAISLLLAGLLLTYRPRITIVSAKASPTAYYNLVRCILRLAHHSPEEADKIVNENLRVESFNPTAYTLTEIYDMIRTTVDNTNPDVFILEGVDVLELFAEQREYLELIYNLMLRNKRRRVTSVYVFSSFSREDLYRRLAASLADITIYVGEPSFVEEERRVGQTYVIEYAGLFGRTEVRALLNTTLLYRHGCIG